MAKTGAPYQGCFELEADRHVLECDETYRHESVHKAQRGWAANHMLLVRADYLGLVLALSTGSRLPVQHRSWCAGEHRPSTERSSFFGVKAALGHTDRVPQMPASALGSRADWEACWNSHQVIEC